MKSNIPWIHDKQIHLRTNNPITNCPMKTAVVRQHSIHLVKLTSVDIMCLTAAVFTILSSKLLKTCNLNLPHTLNAHPSVHNNSMNISIQLKGWSQVPCCSSRPTITPSSLPTYNVIWLLLRYSWTVMVLVKTNSHTHPSLMCGWHIQCTYCIYAHLCTPVYWNTPLCNSLLPAHDATLPITTSGPHMLLHSLGFIGPCWEWHHCVDQTLQRPPDCRVFSD